jgi:hypothetical protein
VDALAGFSAGIFAGIFAGDGSGIVTGTGSGTVDGVGGVAGFATEFPVCFAAESGLFESAVVEAGFAPLHPGSPAMPPQIMAKTANGGTAILVRVVIAHPAIAPTPR